MKNKFFYIKKNKQKEIRNNEIIASIIKTKTELNTSIKNYEYAEKELVDFYLYQIKACQAKLDYLIKLAKENERLERELQNVQRFMEQTRIDDRPIAEFYEESKKEQTAKHHDEWLASTYNDR